MKLIYKKYMTDSTKQGWVRFYRKSIDSTVFENPTVWFVWSWCLLKANHQKNKFPFNGTDIEILPGQFIFGQNRALSELRTLTPQRLRTAIKYLKSTSRLTIKSNNKFSIITILNWDNYQVDNKQNNKPLTNEQQTTNKPITTNKNVKKEKNDKNIIAETSSANLVPEIIKAFEEINPASKKFYGNTTQRKACNNLIALYGLDQVLKVISFLPKSNSMPYMPRITTPLQLEDKWSALESALKQKKSEKISKSTPNFII